ncbi:MAG TPA: glycosyltransferase family 4 protein [Streptosporangiaceae bacterium]|nr:glycosyltransferase family 4 protein [Streptosporangiaceae bacterium]
MIAIVSDAIHPYHRGGKELRYQELIWRLAARGDVHVYTMHWWNGPKVRHEDGVAFHAISRLVPLYVKDRRSLWQAAVFGLACLRMLGRDFDVLEADHIPFAQVLVLRLVTWLKRKPFVVTWHEVWGRSYWRQYLGRLGFVAWLIESLAMRLPDHIIAASPQTAERLRGLVGEKPAISVAPNGMDLAEVAITSPDSAPTDIAVVGRLMPHKRVDMLLDALALLRAEGTTLTCRVIGDGPEKAALCQRVRDLGLTGAVEFRHDVSEQKDVYGLLKAARVCVFPSAREGFGIAVLEALACGVPVVTTSAPDNMARHLVQRSVRGTVCEPSAAALATAIKAALAGPGAGEPDLWLREYSWDATADRVAEAFGI